MRLVLYQWLSLLKNLTILLCTVWGLYIPSFLFYFPPLNWTMHLGSPPSALWFIKYSRNCLFSPSLNEKRIFVKGKATLRNRPTCTFRLFGRRQWTEGAVVHYAICGREHREHFWEIDKQKVQVESRYFFVWTLVKIGNFAWRILKVMLCYVTNSPKIATAMQHQEECRVCY